jgi:predicted alpha/beta-fold hydrolase
MIFLSKYAVQFLLYWKNNLVTINFISRACPVMEEWEGLRRCYNWLITQKVKSVIKRHTQELLGGCSNTPYQEFKRNKVLMATSLKEIDEHFGRYCLLFQPLILWHSLKADTSFFRKMAGYQSVDDYYKYSSSSYYIDKVSSYHQTSTVPINVKLQLLQVSIFVHLCHTG